MTPHQILHEDLQKRKICTSLDTTKEEDLHKSRHPVSQMSIFSRDITVFFARMPRGQQPHTLLTRPHTTSFFFSISESKNCPHTKIYEHCMCQEEYMSNGWIKCSSFGFLVQHLDRYEKYVPVIGDYSEVTSFFLISYASILELYCPTVNTHTFVCACTCTSP